MLQRLSASVLVDTDEVSPECLKASFAYVVDALARSADRVGVAIDWNTVEMAQNRRGPETDIVLRAGVVS